MVQPLVSRALPVVFCIPAAICILLTSVVTVKASWGREVVLPVHLDRALGLGGIPAVHPARLPVGLLRLTLLVVVCVRASGDAVAVEGESRGCVQLVLAMERGVRV